MLTGELDRSFQFFDIAIELSPNDPALYIDRGTAYARNGELGSAIEDFDRALQIDPRTAGPTSTGASPTPGRARTRGHHDLDEAIRLEPTDGRAFANRGIARVGLGELAAAVQDYDSAVKFNPYHPLGYVNRAIANAILGNDEAVQEDITQAVELGYDEALLLAQLESAKQRRQ